MTKAEIIEELRERGAMPVMNTAQAADVLGTSERMVRIYARQGRLEGRKDRSNHCIYTLEAVAGFVMENHRFLISPDSREAARLEMYERRERAKIAREDIKKELEEKRRRTEEERIIDELDYSGMSDEEAETRREAARIIVCEWELKKVEEFIKLWDKTR